MIRRYNRVCHCGSLEAIKLVSDAITGLAADVHVMVWMLLVLFLCMPELKTVVT
jgi:hypothetical protein